MKKAIFDEYGGIDTIRVIDAEEPIVSTGEVLVEVNAAALNPKDILIRKGKFKSFSGKAFPQSIGFDFAGTVLSDAGGTYKKGDRVFGMLNGWKGRCCAERLNVKATELYYMPKGLSFEEAAGMPLVGQTALQALRDKGKLIATQNICINGASGGVGTMAIQIAKILGASVTTISSHNNLAFCQSLGANQSLDYAKVDVLQSKDKFDIFFDVFGNYSFKKCAPILTPKGIYITTVPGPEVFKEQFWNLFRGKKAKMVIVKSKSKDIRWLKDHIDTQELQPVLDKVFKLEEIGTAQVYVESKRAKGKVVLVVKGA